ncbi:sensor histidine kinase [Paraclostridium ghonii]|uniref:histidine kinase n=1 Tax=Paraclostridium ghonii TaxID=29358 RepID=A0ABU0N1V5_9FIRM|nr:sensor histidine kinase [Paeniclostridium ghonii]MDQ0556716.1 signal transduction histidine kinase [Paeniclostridium ghonii]
MKKKQKKGLKFITLIILLASTAILGATLGELRFGDTYQHMRFSDIVDKSNKLYADNFFESNFFENYTLQMILSDMEVSTSKIQRYTEEEILGARNRLDELKDIKFFVENDSTGISYTNTNFGSNDEFRKYQKDYCNLEFAFKGDLVSYTKVIDNKQNAYKVSREKFNGVIQDNINISMSFPKEPINNSYVSGGNDFNTDYYGFEYYKNLSKNSTRILITSAIISFISLIAFIKNKENLINDKSSILKMHKKIPLEVYIFIFLILGFLAVSPLSLWGSAILKFIFLSFTYAWITSFVKLDSKIEVFKNSITYKCASFIISVIANTIRYWNKVHLIRKLVLFDILILMFTPCLPFLMMLLYNNRFYLSVFKHLDLFSIVIFILIVVSLILFIVTGYIINKLVYIDDIIKGTEKIKNGNISHKIKLKGDNGLTILAENINNLSDGLENAIGEKLKSERMKTELITNVSHDLKTPLTSIINYVDLIKKEKNIQPEYLNDYVDVLDKKSKRLKNLIDDLFEASKASSGNIDLNIEKLDLNQLLRQSIGENEEKLIQSNLSLKVNVPKEPVYINCDGKRMYRVFENLLINISKYSHENTRVYVDMILDEDTVCISMKNISAYELNFEASEIIERFKRGDLARNTEGSGLGLAIARDLVHLQGGNLDVLIDGDLFKVELSFNTI